MEKRVSVTFDRNVYEFVADPDKEGLTRTQKIEYQEIHNLVKAGLIVPFISEPALTLDTLQKKQGNRKQVLSSRERIVILDNKEKGDTSSITISSNPNIHPGNHKKDDIYLTKAIDIGFRILPIYRIGRIINPLIKSEWRYFIPTEDIFDIPNKFSEVLRTIESNGVGFARVYEVLGIRPDDIKPWYEHIKNYTGTDKKFDEAIAEWSDGDSVAAHIASQIDYFCTNDLGKSTKGKSVFSSTMRKLLNELYGLKVVTPSELLTF